MGYVIAVANQKGGVAKTTSVVNLADALGQMKKSVLIIDLDPQGNATSGYGINRRKLENCVYNVLVENVPAESAVVKTKYSGVHVLPATINLAGAEIELVSAVARESKLKRAISHMRERYDYILIDCPTAYNAATVAALGAADEIIIPVELEGFSLHGAGEIRSQVANMRTVNPRLRIAGALITKRRGTRIQEAAEQALRVSGIPAFEAAIPLRASVPASMSNLNASKTLRGYAPKDAATKAYHDFTREYLSKGGAVNG